MIDSLIEWLQFTASSASLSIISALDAINPDYQLFTCISCGSSFGNYEFEIIYNAEESHTEIYTVVRQLQALKLTPEELAVIKAHLFYNSGCYYNINKHNT